jgi:predicted nucleic acid-binding protein
VVRVLVDSDVLIDFLNGLPQAVEEFKRHDDIAVSIISWVELLVGAHPDRVSQTKLFLARFERGDLDDAVAEEAARLRFDHRLKLPDAVIWASARVDGRLLVTRNSRDFPANDPGVRIPYRLG